MFLQQLFFFVLCVFRCGMVFFLLIQTIFFLITRVFVRQSFFCSRGSLNRIFLFNKMEICWNLILLEVEVDQKMKKKTNWITKDSTGIQIFLSTKQFRSPWNWYHVVLYLFDVHSRKKKLTAHIALCNQVWQWLVRSLKFSVSISWNAAKKKTAFFFSFSWSHMHAEAFFFSRMCCAISRDKRNKTLHDEYCGVCLFYVDAKNVYINLNVEKKRERKRAKNTKTHKTTWLHN